MIIIWTSENIKENVNLWYYVLNQNKTVKCAHSKQTESNQTRATSQRTQANP